MSDVQVRLAQPADVAQVACMMAELRREIKADAFVDRISASRLDYWLNVSHPYRLHVHVAQRPDLETILGYAIISFYVPSWWLAPAGVLQELYVTRSSRRQGVGRFLFDHVCSYARHHDARTLELSCVAEPGAQAFYASMLNVSFAGKPCFHSFAVPLEGRDAG